ncbi:MAG TPA: phosphatidic acid phosphatase [Erysipelotrichaceae bacterium]|nr:phosphatidic acid phosphatase [Erysipelotrichaceae bacterium]
MGISGIILLSSALLLPGKDLYQPADTQPVSGFPVSITEAAEESELLTEDGVTLREPGTATTTDTGEETAGLDIRYLLFLQDFRNSINDAWTPFMEFVSNFATRYLILAVLFIYWALNKRDGLYAIASMCLTLGINQVVKLTACVYRPWIRDPRIIPAGDAITSATGYSFPSGHTATAAPLFGGMAAKADKRHRWLPVLCVLGTMLVGFSRNYLGVHTPQDVFVAICESVLCLIIMEKIFAYLRLHPEMEDRFLLAGVVVGFISIAYITFKPYPMTYVDGKLLVDPQKMMNDGYGDIAFLIAFCIGRFIERRWVRFKPAGLNTKGVIVCAVGMIIFVLLNNNIGKPLDNLLGSHWGHFARRLITILYYTALYPLIIKLVMKQTDDENSEQLTVSPEVQKEPEPVGK